MSPVAEPDPGAWNVVIVFPCYNEERRLQLDELARLQETPGVRLLFVEDGSTDGTAAMLREHCARSGGRAELLSLPENVGKAEAVRAGMLHALDGGAAVVGYVDSDMSTPVDEVRRLLRALAPGVAVVLGARVALLGTTIERRPLRHYVGRVFATAASLILNLRVYDTQCGAKFFRDGPALRGALDEPFSSRWAFDVELIGRLLVEGLPPAGIIEVPLQRWSDVGGSKLRPATMVRSGLELGLIWARLERRRRKRAGLAPRSRPG